MYVCAPALLQHGQMQQLCKQKASNAAAPSTMCPILHESSTLGEEVQAALTESSIELT